MKGRRSKYTPEVARAIVDALKIGVTMKGAAHSAGIQESTLHAWRHKHPEFAESVTRAIGESERALVEVARTGDDPRVAVMILERRFRDGWSKGEKHDVVARQQVTTVSPEVIKAFANTPERQRKAQSLHTGVNEPTKGAK